MTMNNNGVISASMRARLSGIASGVTTTPRERFTNAELLTRARTGSTGAVRSNAAMALRQRITGIVWSIAALHVGLTNEDREDITQDTLLKLIGTPSIEDPHPAYVKRIVSNILIDRHRHATSRGLVCKVSNSDEVLSIYAESVAAECKSEADVPSTDFLLSVLNDRERNVVSARIAGRSHAEIAESLGVSSPSVRKMHERALDKLRKAVPTTTF
ncbi:MAG: Sigma-70, region 4 [Armatimonadota bacterium]|jgi:RNA polymerase sigma factor (sigma-70 family)